MGSPFIPLKFGRVENLFLLVRGKNNLRNELLPLFPQFHETIENRCGQEVYEGLL